MVILASRMTQNSQGSGEISGKNPVLFTSVLNGVYQYGKYVKTHSFLIDEIISCQRKQFPAEWKYFL